MDRSMSLLSSVSFYPKVKFTINHQYIRKNIVTALDF